MTNRKRPFDFEAWALQKIPMRDRFGGYYAYGAPTHQVFGENPKPEVMVALESLYQKGKIDFAGGIPQGKIPAHRVMVWRRH
jgi:hypothetical protein